MIDAAWLRQRLAARPRVALRLDGFRESAVLVPLLVEPGTPERLLFTVRRADLPTHAGQISFPGGKREPHDPDAAATAIRETSEELGVAPAAVEVLGLLDDVPTPTGFVITPVVARIDGPVALRPSADEVASVFAAGLPVLAARHRLEGTRTFLGITYEMHEYLVDSSPAEGPDGTPPHRIWGATARMVHQLLELVGEP